MLCTPGARWHPEEEKNDPEFAKQLAQGCDIYVNDAFGTAHRAHASTAGGLARALRAAWPAYLPVCLPAGLLACRPAGLAQGNNLTQGAGPAALGCCCPACCSSAVPTHRRLMLPPCCCCWAAGVAAYLSPKVSGFLMKKELDYLGGGVGAGACGWRAGGWAGGRVGSCALSGAAGAARPAAEPALC